MPTYVSLLSWTDQGIRAAKETLDRASAADEFAQSMGGRLKDVYWTLGVYDIVTVTEFPDDETAEAFLLGLGGQGNVRTKTLRAFTSDEMAGVLSKIP
jgi:uncharacterized protein with GYD domain